MTVNEQTFHATRKDVNLNVLYWLLMLFGALVVCGCAIYFGCHLIFMRCDPEKKMRKSVTAKAPFVGCEAR